MVEIVENWRRLREQEDELLRYHNLKSYKIIEVCEDFYTLSNIERQTADVRRQTIVGGWQVRWPVMDDEMWTVRGVHSVSNDI